MSGSQARSLAQAPPSPRPARARTPVADVGQRAPRNWALWVGGALVAVIAAVALAGPDLAPQDPLQEHFIIIDGPRLIKPPFAPLEAPGFPLGSDDWGRDTLSQLLWAVRPTLIMVLTVSAARLGLGMALGVVAGWWTGRGSRLLDHVIAAGLAVPVLFAALAVLAAVGRGWGVWALVLGMTLTGWAETARLMREQTRRLKTEPYVEAAEALGASAPQRLFVHVLPHLAPLAWVLLSLETSSALLTTATLGFLGYFANVIWIPVEDWIALQASGAPELGQMLATATHAQHEPWLMVIAGTVVFVMIVAFHLLAEGLRAALSPDQWKRPSQQQMESTTSLGAWAEGQLFGSPASAQYWSRAAPSLLGVGLVVLLLGGGYALWRSQAASGPTVKLEVPGGHGWAAERRDPYGTLWSPQPGPSQPRMVWGTQVEGGLTGGPAVDADGNLYLNGAGGALHVFTAEGQPVRSHALPDLPVGSPALNLAGDVCSTGVSGAITCFRPSGVLKWSVAAGSSAALAGPVIAPEGTAYYATEQHLIAVGDAGQLVWKKRVPFYAFQSPLMRLSASGDEVFFEDVVYDARTGDMLLERTFEAMDGFIVGGDGTTYLRGAAGMQALVITPESFTLQPRGQLDARTLALGTRMLTDGAAGPDGSGWLMFSNFFSFPRFVFVDSRGNLQGVQDVPYMAARVIAFAPGPVLYVCGFLDDVGLECRGVSPTSGVMWRLAPPTAGHGPAGRPVGGALVNGRLYVALEDGTLFALEDRP